MNIIGLKHGSFQRPRLKVYTSSQVVLLRRNCSSIIRVLYPNLCFVSHSSQIQNANVEGYTKLFSKDFQNQPFLFNTTDVVNNISLSNDVFKSVSVEMDTTIKPFALVARHKLVFHTGGRKKRPAKQTPLRLTNKRTSSLFLPCAHNARRVTVHITRHRHAYPPPNAFGKSYHSQFAHAAIHLSLGNRERSRS